LGQPRMAFLAYLLLLLALPIAAAAWVSSGVGGRMLDPSTKARVRRAWRWLMWPVLVGYLVTAVFGCPAAHNAMAHSMVTAWVEKGLLSPDCVPELMTYASVPLLPRIIFSYVESGAPCRRRWRVPLGLLERHNRHSSRGLHGVASVTSGRTRA
jgi:hypothetical protein